MSKYIKLEGLKWHSPDESIVKPLTEFYITESDIADLPTIEIVECDECLYNDECLQVGKTLDGSLIWLNWCSFGERKDNE